MTVARRTQSNRRQASVASRAVFAALAAAVGCAHVASAASAAKPIPDWLGEVDEDFELEDDPVLLQLNLQISQEPIGEGGGSQRIEINEPAGQNGDRTLKFNFQLEDHRPAVGLNQQFHLAPGTPGFSDTSGQHNVQQQQQVEPTSATTVEKLQPQQPLQQPKVQLQQLGANTALNGATTEADRQQQQPEFFSAIAAPVDAADGVAIANLEGQLLRIKVFIGLGFVLAAVVTLFYCLFRRDDSALAAARILEQTLVKGGKGGKSKADKVDNVCCKDPEANIFACDDSSDDDDYDVVEHFRKWAAAEEADDMLDRREHQPDFEPEPMAEADAAPSAQVMMPPTREAETLQNREIRVVDEGATGKPDREEMQQRIRLLEKDMQAMRMEQQRVRTSEPEPLEEVEEPGSEPMVEPFEPEQAPEAEVDLEASSHEPAPREESCCAAAPAAGPVVASAKDAAVDRLTGLFATMRSEERGSVENSNSVSSAAAADYQDAAY